MYRRTKNVSSQSSLCRILKELVLVYTQDLTTSSEESKFKCQLRVDLLHVCTANNNKQLTIYVKCKLVNQMIRLSTIPCFRLSTPATGYELLHAYA